MSSDEEWSTESLSSSSSSTGAYGHYSPDETDEQRTLRTLHKMNETENLLGSMVKDDDEKKSIESSNASRKDGNQAYIAKKKFFLTFAIESFTESIARAPIDSIELPLAFANRSAMLMKARLYSDALSDIDRAIESNYPEELMSKLYIRQALCYRGLNSTAQAKKSLDNARKSLLKMKLDDPGRFVVEEVLNDPKGLQEMGKPREKWSGKKHLQIIKKKNNEIIGACDGIKMNYSKKEGRFLAATREIKPGEIIYIGEGYAGMLNDYRSYKNCWNCFTQTWSGIPCNGCSKAIFCSIKCRDNAWKDYHEFECPVGNEILMGIDDADNTEEMVWYLGLRLMLRAVKDAGSIEALKKEIERIEAEADPKNQGLTGKVFDGMKITSVYNLPRLVKLRNSKKLWEVSSNAVVFLTALAFKTEFFGKVLTLDEFLGHKLLPFVCGLMTRFLMIAKDNAIFCSDAADPEAPWEERYCAILPFSRLLIHSCHPNVFRCEYDNRIAFYARYTIKPGEKLFFNRMEPFWQVNKDIRQEVVESQTGEKCNCIACKKDWPELDELSCFHDKGLSRDVQSLLDNATRHQDMYHSIIASGNIDKHPRIMSDIVEMIGLLCHHVKMPCYDTMRASEDLEKLYIKLANRYSMF